MTLTIEVTGELEVALKAQAHQQGVSADGMARRILAEALTPVVKREIGFTSELPILHLGTIGSLHRQAIYNDLR